ncbi:hypothetical protein [Pelosinus sp. IPA-1]|nr:hypothetical protein [Pelosinus sp. IPA-1]GMB01766.1 hypothetical protein PIPA1_45660 [Pelosinus sp. IPA-1]
MEKSLIVITCFIVLNIISVVFASKGQPVVNSTDQLIGEGEY